MRSVKELKTRIPFKPDTPGAELRALRADIERLTIDEQQEILTHFNKLFRQARRLVYDLLQRPVTLPREYELDDSNMYDLERECRVRLRAVVRMRRRSDFWYFVNSSKRAATRELEEVESDFVN